jgi:hypothetical protein
MLFENFVFHIFHQSDQFLDITTTSCSLLYPYFHFLDLLSLFIVFIFIGLQPYTKFARTLLRSSFCKTTKRQFSSVLL